MDSFEFYSIYFLQGLSYKAYSMVSPSFFSHLDHYNSGSEHNGGFSVMAEITRMLAANTCRQIFFVITNTASTCCLVEDFQLICYLQRVNAM